MFDYLRQRTALRNALIVAFDVRGCMAQDHEFEWIGRVYDFEKLAERGPQLALVRVIKSNNRTGDIRDGFCGHERVPIANNLQEIQSGLFFWYK